MSIEPDFTLSQPVDGASLRVLNLGAGVQSTTLLLMAARGQIGPMPDCAIFADTGWEPEAVYDHLAFLEEVTPFPIYRVAAGNLRTDLLASATDAERVANPPLYTGNGGKLRRNCTKEYKIEPIIKKVREMIGLKPRQRKTAALVEQWIGISTDEIQRMKMAPERYITSRWPLIEMGMSRNDCKVWLERNGYSVPPKSSCIGCPFHNDDHWRDMKKNDPGSWNHAVEFDKQIRPGIRGTEHEVFLHRQLKPLDEIDLASLEDRGQLSFLDECDGVCGV